MNDRNALRRKIRQQRASLSPRQLARASLKACSFLVNEARFRRAKRIAGYIATNGELDPMPALLNAVAKRKACYLPRLHPFLKGRMWFIRWHPNTPMIVNRFGIAEPVMDQRSRLPAWMLDMVIVPLVAFDQAGHRLGMGQGFYDRGFAFRHHRRRWKRPVLCGFAHHFQQVDALQANPWDVPMDITITDDNALS